MVVEPSINELVKALEFLWINKDIRAEFAELGHGLALSEFTDQIMSKNYQDLYLEVANKYNVITR